MSNRSVHLRHILKALLVATLAPVTCWCQQLVGSVPGSFDVSPAGGAIYQIPIHVPPGTAGVEPALSLVYSSQTPSGALGAGWSLAGLSAITRGPKNARSDPQPDGVRMEESDALYLDGARLIAIASSGNGTTRTIEYRKEIDDQTRVVEVGNDFGTAKFVVNTKGGLRIDFDSVPGTPADQNRGDIRFGDGSVLLRAESRVADTSGNYIDFYYQVNGAGNYDIKTIRYTGHEDTAGNSKSAKAPYAVVDFTYERSPRSVQTYIAGRALSVDVRLTGIVTRIAAKPGDPRSAWLQASRYALDYEDRDAANRFVLKTVHQFGDDNSELTPTSFTYAKPAVGWAAAPYSFPAILAAHEELSTGYRFAHVAPSGSLPDLIYAAEINGVVESFAYQNNGDSWAVLDKFQSPVAFTRADGSDLGVLLLDVDGDGRADILQSYQLGTAAAIKSAYVAGADKFVKTDGYELPFLVSKDGKVVANFRVAKWSGGPGPDIVFESLDQRGFLRNTSNGWQRDDRYAPPLPLDSHTLLVDARCNGKPILIGPQKSTAGTVDWKSFEFSDADKKWVEILDPAFKFPFPASVDPQAVRIITVDATSCPAVLVATAQAGGIHGVYQASSTGWAELIGKRPPFDLVDSAGNATQALLTTADKSGRSDVLASRVFPDGHTVKFFYYQTDTAWQKAPTTFAIPQLITPTSDASRVFVADMTGNGSSNIVIPENSRQTFGLVYQATDDGYVSQTDYVPPVAFARKEHQDWGVRLVDLNGDGLQDLLVSRKGTNGSTGAWVNTGAGWVVQPGLLPPVPFSGDDMAGNPAQFVDVDGDGYVDLLYAYRGKSGIETHAYKNIAAPGGSRTWSEIKPDDPSYSGLIPPSTVAFAADKIGDLGVRFADLAGTGRPFMLVGFQPATGPPQLTAYRNDGTHWVAAPEYAPPIPFVAQQPGVETSATRDLAVQIVDVNGDGLPDLVASYRNLTNPATVTQGVWLNNGHGWTQDASYTVPVSLDGLTWDAQHGLQWERNANVQWADVNGDGLPDIIYTRKEGPTNQSVTYLGTGRGWVATAAWQIPQEAIPARAGDPGFRLIDVNGDGYPDIVYIRKEQDGTISKGLFINNGLGWTPQNNGVVPDLPLVDKDGNDLGVRFFDVDGKGLLDIVQAYSGDTVLGTVDLNQAQRSDVIETIDAGYGLVTNIFYQSLLQNALPNTDGLAFRPEIAWSKVYDPTGPPISYPVVAPVPATYVVRRVITSEGAARQIAFSYRYGQYRMDSLAKQPLGFGWRESLNEANGVLTRTENTQEVLISGRPHVELVCWLDFARAPTGTQLQPNSCPRQGQTAAAPWIKLLKQSEYEWQVEELKVGTGVTPTNSIRQVTLTKTTSYAFELDGNLLDSQTDSFEYDEPQPPDNLLKRRLNVKRLVTERGGRYVTTTENAYEADDEDHWFLGRLTKAVVTKSEIAKPGEQPHKPEIRSAGFTYFDETGLLKSEVANLGTAHEVTTTYRRDMHGNITHQQVHASGLVDHDPTIYGYDEVGRFKTLETNPLHQTTRHSFYPTSGLPRSTTSPNGVTTQLEYDGVGRQTKSIVPTSVDASITTTTRYLLLSALDPSIPTAGVEATLAVIVTASDGTQTLPPSVKLLDAKGRMVRTIQEGFIVNASQHRYIVRDAVYDLFGQIVRTSLPYEGNHKPIWAVVTRDVLGREIAQITPDHREIRTAYAGLPTVGSSVTVWDVKRNLATTTERDARGLLTRAIDAVGNPTRYEYDLGGRTTRIVDVMRNVTAYEYDDFGNRKRASDPDLGTYRYEYDSLGRLVEQHEGNAGDVQISRLAYDELGRIKQLTRQSEVWTWDYDTADHGIGKIASVKNASGRYMETHQYDAVGRENGLAVSINGETFVTAQNVDSFGRVRHIDYPGGFSVDNIYDRKGFLVRVVDGATSHPYWSLSTTDVFGHVMRDTLGNGVRETNTYDDTTARPMTRTAMSASGERALDLTLQYDPTGNLLHRGEATQHKSENFVYDKLDRLRTLTRAGQPGDRYDYDAVGRVTYKSGLGAFHYANGALNKDPACQSAPVAAHAVIATEEDQGSYAYDCHGNMVRNGTDIYTYSSNNRLTRVEHDPAANADQWVQFEYGPSGERYREVDKHGWLQVEKLSIGAYERVTEFDFGANSNTPRFVRHRWFLGVGGSTFAVVEKAHEQFPMTPGTIFHPGALEIGSVPVDTTNVWYLHKDQLGSILAITDQIGTARAKYWYDPWGKRLASVSDPSGVPSGDRLEDSWDRGFVGQEHFADFDLIHLNGRVYDWRLARFVSPDPLIQVPQDSQQWDSYGYSRDNPLRFSDPSGYGLFDSIAAPFKAVGNAVGSVARAIGNGISSAVQGIGHAIGEVGKWIGENWKSIVIVAAVIVVTVATAGTGTLAAASLGTAILSGMAAGATAGALSAALYGGSLEDVLVGAIKGGVIGAVSGAAFYGVGTLTAGGGTLKNIEAVAGHGIIGGARDAASGGNFWQGFEAGALTKVSSIVVPSFGDATLDTARAAAVGGAAAAIGGGNFVNGAVTGAFSYAFNDAMHQKWAFNDEPIRPTASPIDLLAGAVVAGWGAVVEVADYFSAETLEAGAELSIESEAPAEYSLTRTVENNIETRPYINSPLTVQEIESTGMGVRDPGGVPGALRYDVPGSFNGSQGNWELVIDRGTNTIYHFLFKSGP